MGECPWHRVQPVTDASPEFRQRVLDAVTDSSLAELDLGKLLDTLLERVRRLFDVDTVTVLLLDTAGEHLVPTTAVGLEEEVYQGVRVPIGTGFAGQVALTREPMVLDQVDSTTVVNSLLWERGLRVLLGVPMVAGGQLSGVLHIGSTSARRFGDEEIESLQLVADRLALAAHAYRSRSERAATTMLQDSLLPARLPAVPGWDLAARYVPGANSGVGGDWYDVLPLPDRLLGLVIGDVVGKGLAAAVVMGRLRSALRAYALEYPDPAEVLGKLDRKASHFEHNAMATVGYAVVDVGTGRVRLSLAGHPPPVIAVPGRPTALADVPVDPPVGMGLKINGRRAATIDLPSDGLITLFTDGLIERRGASVDEGLARLVSVVDPAPAEWVCARIMAAMVGTRPAIDDIALLAAHRTAPGTEE
jgi:phosphoserine phosphatase RsbU/P